MMHHSQDEMNSLSRRGLFERMAGGTIAAALLHLLSEDLYGAPATAARKQNTVSHQPYADPKPRAPHFEPRAKSVIHLFMNGGPSQMDLFDPKEELEKHHGEPYFNKIAGEVENPTAAGALMRSPFKFSRHGESGCWVSEVMPHLARQVDDIAFIRSMHTTNLTHEPAIYLAQSGEMLPGYPTLGAWVTYALGSVNQNLPAYLVLDDPQGLPVNGVDNWASGFLSPMFAGTRFRSQGAPVLNLKPEVDKPEEIIALERELIARLDRIHQRRRPGNPQLEARIANYALAGRMQLAATDALDLSKESQQTRDAYGVDQEPTDSYGRRCLIARRLVERGVRFVQLYINRQIWDHHTEIDKSMRSSCARTDQPIAALLRDLKERGLFDSTLVVWGGEFGRLPIAQLTSDKDPGKSGRDHNKNAFCTWMAGAGIKGGTMHGETDEIGLAAVKDKVSVPDWHATILHLLGLDDKKLSVRRNGLEDRLTGVHESRVVEEILA